LDNLLPRRPSPPGAAMNTNTESPAALSFARDDIVLHKKTQHTYRVLGLCIIEATLADCYMYRGSDGRTWIRPVAEMEDGRFVLVEYDADRGNHWVPHPISYTTWLAVAPAAGFNGARLLGRVPSRFLNAIYASVATS